MNTIFINIKLVLIFLLTFSSCEKNHISINSISQQKIDSLSVDFNELKSEFDTTSISDHVNKDWFLYYQNRIEHFNPNIELADLDSIQLFLVPSLNISFSDIEKSNFDIYTLIKKGKISNDRSQIYVCSNNKLFGIIKNDRHLRPQNFHPALQNFDISFIFEPNLFFKLNIIDDTGTLPLPGIFYMEKNQLKNINYKNENIDLDQYIETNYKNEKGFQRMVSSIFNSK